MKERVEVERKVFDSSNISELVGGKPVKILGRGELEEPEFLFQSFGRSSRKNFAVFLLQKAAEFSMLSLETILLGTFRL